MVRAVMDLEPREARGVLAGAFPKRATKETRDRAERGSAVRGSARASVAPKRTPTPTDRATISTEPTRTKRVQLQPADAVSSARSARKGRRFPCRPAR